jgi:hypothetical protein
MFARTIADALARPGSRWRWCMSKDDLDRDDDPETIAAAVRALATDAHATLNRASGDGHAGHDEPVGDLRRRADGLLILLR